VTPITQERVILNTYAPLLLRLQAREIGDDRVGLAARHEKAGHGAEAARFAMRLREKVAQGSFRHIGPRGDLGEGRRGRLERRRLDLVRDDDMTACTDFERNLAAVGDLAHRRLRGRRDDPWKRNGERQGGNRSHHGVLEGRAGGRATRSAPFEPHLAL